MQCDICLRTGGQKLPLLCPTDARNQLYEPRIQLAEVLIEKDALDQQITTSLSSRSKLGEQEDDRPGNSRLHVDMIIAEKEQAEDRTQQIIAHADELRANIGKAREEIARRRAAIRHRRSEREAISNGLEARRARQMEEVEKVVRMTRYKWNQVHSITASSKAFLCGEAAKLYGLRKVKRNSGAEEYRIGGVGIVDLRAMNTTSPAQISTSLSHIVHLLILSTHYLAIRLPAEITLPHRDYPLPTIFPLFSSYKYENVPFPGTIPASPNPHPQQHPLPRRTASPNTASPTREQPKPPRPRPLFVQRPLPLFAADDPAGHALFLEGVTLLAYDVAWLCRSQGVPVGEVGNFEDVCNIGQNLFNLLIATQGRGPSRTSSTKSTPTKTTGREGEVNGEREKERAGGLMGYYSHGTAHSYLGSSAGVEFTRGFKLPSPTKLVDKLKSRLASEVANAEWEILDPDAWAIEDDLGQQQQQEQQEMLLGEEGDGIVVGARREGDDVARGLFGWEGGGGGNAVRRYGYGMQSFMSMRTVMDAVEVIGGVAAGGERKSGSGTSGWTKLKPR